MERDNYLNIPFLDFRRLGSLRTKCFFWRFRLGMNTKTLKYTIGIFFNLHPIASCLIITVSPRQVFENYYKYELALIPLICLGIEIFIISSIILGTAISDYMRFRSMLTVWHREALWILFRNLVVASGSILTCLLTIVYVESKYRQIEVDSVSIILAPVIALLCLTALKLCLITSRYSLYWLLFILISLTQVFLLVMKFDYDTDHSWWLVMFPSFLFSPLLGYRVLTSLIKSVHRQSAEEIVFKGVALLGILLSLPSLFFLLMSFEVDDYLNNVEIALIWLCILCISVGFSKNTGVLIYNMLLGHIETDYFHFMHPAPRNLSMRRSDSDLFRNYYSLHHI